MSKQFFSGKALMDARRSLQPGGIADVVRAWNTQSATVRDLGLQVAGRTAMQIQDEQRKAARGAIEMLTEQRRQVVPSRALMDARRSLQPGGIADVVRAWNTQSATVRDQVRDLGLQVAGRTVMQIRDEQRKAAKGALEALTVQRRQVVPGKALMEAQQSLRSTGLAGVKPSWGEQSSVLRDQLRDLGRTVDAGKTVMQIRDEQRKAAKGALEALTVQRRQVVPGKALMEAQQSLRSTEIAGAVSSSTTTPPGGVVSRGVQVRRAAVPVVRPESPNDARGPSPAYDLVGMYAADLRVDIGAWLEREGFVESVEELEAIDERLSCSQRVACRHAADSTRRLLVTLADRLFPPRNRPYCDRWEQERDVTGDKVVNRILAFVDDRLRNRLSPEEQKALGAELYALWRSVSVDVHRGSQDRDVASDYFRLLRALSLVRQATEIR